MCGGERVSVWGRGVSVWGREGECVGERSECVGERVGGGGRTHKLLPDKKITPGSLV